jgi:hypothetical protein
MAFEKLYEKYRADLEVQKSAAEPDKNQIKPE